MPSNPVADAKRVAAEVLWPDAIAVDAGDRVPQAHLDALDTAGLTGLTATEHPLAVRVAVTEALAGACLATAFVWLQHQGALAGTIRASAPGSRFAADLSSGALRAGIAITALRGAHPVRIRAEGDRWSLTGHVSWTTGWGLVDLIRIAALDGDTVRTALIDARDAETLHAQPIDLIAARASRTVALDLRDHPVPADRLLEARSAAEWRSQDAAGLAGNGALALGVAARAAALAGSDRLAADVDTARGRLLTAQQAELPAARAACSALAVRAAAVLAIQEGAGSVVRGGHAERLVREAQFLTVFGGRPAIRERLLATFGA